MTGAIRIMVTGVGGAPGFDLAESLIRRGVEVIGTDADPLAPGLRIPGITPLVSVPAGQPGYQQALLESCRQLRPDGLFSTVEHELPDLMRMGDELAAAGVRTWIPPLHAIDACIDKAVFARVMAEAGVPAPRTWLPGSDVPDIPLVVKPRRGQGAKNVYFCGTSRQAVVLCQLVADPLIQAWAEGREFTADCLADRDGRTSVVLRWRLLVKGGLSMVSETFRDPEVEDVVRRALAALGMRGPCCVQGIVRGNGTDPRVAILEANARLAGAFRVSEIAGAELTGQALNGLLGRPVDHGALTSQPGVRVTRYVATFPSPVDGMAAGPASHAERVRSRP